MLGGTSTSSSSPQTGRPDLSRSAWSLQPRMLLGVDLKGVQQVFLVRPPNLEHSLVQVLTVALVFLSSIVSP